MRRLIILFFCCFIVADAFSNITATRSSVDYVPYFSNQFSRTAPVALETHEDLAIMLDWASERIVSLRRNESGVYHIVDSRPHQSTASNANFIIASTNGRWAARATYLAHEIFELDNDATFVNKTYTINLANSFGGWIFEDGSYVAIATDAIYTYEFNGTDWSLAHKDIPDNYTLLNSYLAQYRFVVRKQLNYYISIDVGLAGLIIYRNEDKSWSTFAFVPYEASVQNSLSYTHLLWDLNNTIIVSTFGPSQRPPQPAGSIVIYTKGALGWELKQNITAASLGITGDGYFGDELVQVDSNNFIVTAPFDGLEGSSYRISGSIWWLQRDDSDTWRITRRITSPVGDGIMGWAVALLNDKAFITVECNSGSGVNMCLINTVELCNEDPTNVTCHDQQLSSCSSFDIDINSLYTINTPSKCGEVRVQPNNVIRSNAQGYQLDLTFTRSGSADVICTVNVLCDKMTPFAPVSVSIPQSPTKDTTSGSTILRHTAFMILSISLSIVML